MAARRGGLFWRLVVLLQLCGCNVAGSRLRQDRQAGASASAPAAAPGAASAAGASASAGAQHPQKSFAAFVATHGRQYRPGSVEYWRRQSLFERRQEEAAWQNERPDRLWTAGVNAFADWTEEELRQLRGYRPGFSGSGAGAGGSSRLSALSTLGRSGKVGPSQDWRHLPVLQKPKDQGSCGSCWAIAAATLVEAYAQKANPATAEAPSVQQLVACTPNPQKCGGGGGCTGATIDLALDYALAHGVSSESQWPYRPYLITGPPGSMSQCPASASAALQVFNGTATPNVSAARDTTLAAASNASVARLVPAAHALTGVAVPFTRYEILPKNDYTSLLQALYERGPVGVSVAASTWFPYEYGIWDHCPEPEGAEVDHAVVAVAYGQQGDGKKYWTLMNSWGYDWGENGYIRLLRRDDDGSRCATNHHPEKGTACLPYPAQQTVCGMCGILFESVVPVL